MTRCRSSNASVIAAEWTVGFDGPVRPVRVALVATLTQVLIHAMVEPTIHGPTMAIPFVYLLAWLALQSDSSGKVAA